MSPALDFAEMVCVYKRSLHGDQDYNVSNREIYFQIYSPKIQTENIHNTIYNNIISCYHISKHIAQQHEVFSL